MRTRFSFFPGFVSVFIVDFSLLVSIWGDSWDRYHGITWCSSCEAELPTLRCRPPTSPKTCKWADLRDSTAFGNAQSNKGSTPKWGCLRGPMMRLFSWINGRASRAVFVTVWHLATSWVTEEADWSHLCHSEDRRSGSILCGLRHHGSLLKVAKFYDQLLQNGLLPDKCIGGEWGHERDSVLLYPIPTLRGARNWEWSAPQLATISEQLRFKKFIADKQGSETTALQGAEASTGDGSTRDGLSIFK